MFLDLDIQPSTIISIAGDLKQLWMKKVWLWRFHNLKKAVNVVTVNHNILLQKLEHYDIREVSLLWFNSYLEDRMQYVHLNGANSETTIVICGNLCVICVGSTAFFALY